MPAEALDDLRLRIEDRFADVVLVGDDGAVVGQRDRSCRTRRRGPDRGRWRHSCGRCCTRISGRASRPAMRASLPRRRPAISDSRSAPSLPPSRSCRSAACRSTRRRRCGSVRSSWPGTTWSCSGSAARPPSRGTTGKKRLWITSSEASVMRMGRFDRNVQRVDLALAAGMLELPHPLLAGGVDVEGVVGDALRCGSRATSPRRT